MYNYNITMETINIRNSAYNFLNFLIFIALYTFITLYHYRLNTPATYYIGMFVDIIFCIYLVNFTAFHLYAYDTLFTSLSLIVIFGFIVLRLISTITFPYYFLKIETERKDNECKWEEVSKQITNLIDMNKLSYLYSTVGILLLLWLILFWSEKINSNFDYERGLGMDNRAYIGFFVIILLLTFSIMNTYYSLKLAAVVNRTKICNRKVEQVDDGTN